MLNQNIQDNLKLILKQNYKALLDLDDYQIDRNFTINKTKNQKMIKDTDIDCCFFYTEGCKLKVLGEEFGFDESGEVKKLINDDENSYLVKRPYLDRDTVIFCCPNGMEYQNFGMHSSQKILRHLYSLKFNVFVWNYRGYG